MLKARIQTYLQNTMQNPNMMQDMVLEALNVPLVMALCRVLRIVSSSVTLPYWILVGWLSWV